MAIRSRTVTSTTTFQFGEGGYVYYDNGTKRRKMTAAEQAQANRDYDVDAESKKHRAGRNVSISSNTSNYTKERGWAFNTLEALPPKPAPAPKKTTPPPPKPGYMGAGVGSLPIKKSSTLETKKIKPEDAKIITKKLTTEVPVAVEKPTKKRANVKDGGLYFKRGVKSKQRKTVSISQGNFSNREYTRGSGSKITGIGYKKTSESSKAATKANRAENKSTRAARRTFGKEEKLATGYLKNRGIIEGDTKKEMKSNIKSYAKYTKAQAKKTGNKEEMAARRGAIKSAKTAAKYVGKLEKGKIRSFTPEALDKRKTVAAKVKTTTAGKGKNKMTTSTIVPTKKSTRMQAGRYVY